jgi:GT2 family glycosyltransferase
VQNTPTASVVVPTRGRPDYLEVTLASVVPQAVQVGAEVLVVSDGPDEATAAVARRHETKLISLRTPTGLNAARNAARAAVASELVVFVDDDVDAPPGWLAAMLAGVRSAPDHDVFGGPIRARLEGGGPRACGREPVPITTLDLGPEDRDASFVWGANMAIRARAFERIGGFNESIFVRGDEEDWQRRYSADGGRIRYVAGAGLDHRRSATDSTVRMLSRAAYGHGRAARRYDVLKGTAPTIPAELRTLAGCVWHTIRRRCAIGVVLGAHTAGRLREASADRRAVRGKRRSATGDPLAPVSEDFLSGTSGQVSGIKRTSAAVLADALDDLAEAALVQRRRLRRAALAGPRRRVLALGIERAGAPNLLAATRAELLRSRHDVRFVSTDAGDRGKFENLNALLAEHPVNGSDWLVVVDDDVALPPGFLDSFLFLAERFQLQLAQPAHKHRSHAAWAVTRRQRGTVLRETAFVEIGPVFAFQAVTFDVLLPFPALRVGWGLDVHWSAVAREHGWRLGVVDATPVRHGLRPIAASYDRIAATEEGRRFLATRPYTSATDAQRTLATHRSWPRR